MKIQFFWTIIFIEIFEKFVKFGKFIKTLHLAHFTLGLVSQLSKLLLNLKFIGVTRGFGDHDLKAQSNGATPVYIKPFLTPQPEVRVLDIENETVTENDVLVMATDGLWDVVSIFSFFLKHI